MRSARRLSARGLLRTFALLLFAAALAGAAAYYWHVYWPSSQHRDYTFNEPGNPVFYKGEELKPSAKGSGDGLKLPFELIRTIIDPTIHYEAESQSVIVTTANKVIRLKTSQLTGTINEKPFKLQFPVEKEGDTVYVPIEPLKELYPIELRQSSDTGAVIVHKKGDAIAWASAKQKGDKPDETRALRAGPTVKADIYTDVPQGERVMIWKDAGDWFFVQLENGYTGYMRKQDLTLEQPEVLPEPAKPETPYVPWKPVGGKINLTWQQVYNKTPDPTKYGPMPGLNVISPQWFMLADDSGTIKQTADSSFMQWARSQNLQVWALFNNGFDPKRTSEALSTYDKRMNMIRQIVSFVQLYKLQGINVDFENVYLKDKAVFVQFIRELTPFLHEQGAVVSVDVTVKDGSETYSLFLDRRALAESVDYMMVMTYDEHWGSSPVAGSVASLPWVEKGIVQIMKEDDVPASKLLLGVPYYTRIWTEKTKDGKTTVTSKAVGMESIDKLLAEKKLKPTLDEASGQNYVEYKEDSSTTVKIWIEDEVSMKKRIELVKTYDLAGVASWSRGQEKASIWPLIKETLEKRP